MLVLSRKPGEEIVIANNIIVRVQRIVGQRITLAIDAPKEIPIRRGELAPRTLDGAHAALDGVETQATEATKV